MLFKWSRYHRQLSMQVRWVFNRVVRCIGPIRFGCATTDIVTEFSAKSESAVVFSTKCLDFRFGTFSLCKNYYFNKKPTTFVRSNKKTKSHMTRNKPHTHKKIGLNFRHICQALLSWIFAVKTFKIFKNGRKSENRFGLTFDGDRKERRMNFSTSISIKMSWRLLFSSSYL